MFLVFIADQYSEQGGVADLVGTIEESYNKFPESLIPLFRKYAGSDEARHTWTACSAFVSILNPATMEKWGAEFDLNLQGSLGFRPPQRIKVKDYDYYQDGESKVLPMIPGARDVDWLQVLGYKAEELDAEGNTYDE
jgi:hypothetical protein